MEENKNKTVEDGNVKETNKKAQVKPLPIVYQACILCAFLGGLLTFVFLVTVSDRLLFHLVLKNGVNPIWVVIVMILLFLLGSVYFFRLAKKNKNLYLPLAFLLLASGLVNIGFYIYRGYNDEIIDREHLNTNESEKLAIMANEHGGYNFITTVTGYEVGDDGNYKEEKKFFLYIKIIEGRRFYYISESYHFYSPKYVVERFAENKGEVRWEGKSYIIIFDFDWNNMYVRNNGTGNRNFSQNAISSAAHENNSYNTSDESQKIIVEHQRQMIPVQEWVPCGTCKGGRKCMVCGGNGWLPGTRTLREDCYSCNGNKDCPACGGQGGQYMTMYR